MNKLYDKLLLVIGVLALLSGIVFYVLNSNMNSLTQAQAGQSGSSQYKPIPVPEPVESYTTWPNAVEQAPGELYDVFTPPFIYVDKNGTFIFESPIEDLLPEPFGVYLAKLEREPYRIQFEGYIEEDLRDASKSLLLFFDQERKVRVRTRVNDVVAESGFTILNFTIDRIRGADGNIKKLAVATLRDHRDARKRYLEPGKVFYKKNATILLRSREDPTFEIKITEEPPVAFETSLGRYVLEKINLEESSVTVKKLGNDVPDSEIKTLYPVSNDEVTGPSESMKSKVDTESQFFEFQF